MIQWISNLFKDKELEARLASFETSLDNLKADKEKAEQQLAQANQELSVFRDKQAADEARRNSKDPWVEIRSADYNEARGIHIELDWNDAFIVYLKESGIKGKTDEEIVQKWLAMMYQHLVEKLEEKVIDDKEKTGTTNDFV